MVFASKLASLNVDPHEIIPPQYEARCSPHLLHWT